MRDRRRCHWRRFVLSVLVTLCEQGLYIKTIMTTDRALPLRMTSERGKIEITQEHDCLLRLWLWPLPRLLLHVVLALLNDSDDLFEIRKRSGRIARKAG